MDFEKIRPLLPKTAMDLIGLIGLDGTCLFLQEFGGCSFVRSSLSGLNIADFMAVSKAIGKYNAIKIRQYAKKRRGDYLYIPKCAFLLQDMAQIKPKRQFVYTKELEPFLPKRAIEILKAIGGADFERFINHFGGKDLMIPKSQKSPNYLKIADIIDIASANALIQLYNGEKIYIPTCSMAMQKLRDKQIVREYEDMIRGNTQAFIVQKLAKKYRLSDKTIYSILNNTAL